MGDPLTGVAVDLAACPDAAGGDAAAGIRPAGTSHLGPLGCLTLPEAAEVLGMEAGSAVREYNAARANLRAALEGAQI